MEEITIVFEEQALTVNIVEEEVVFNFECTMPGIGVPAGGSVGEVLTKYGAGDYQTEWAAPGASASYETYPAGQNLSAGRVVIIDGGEAFYFQNTDATHVGRAYGVTKTSATTGNNVSIQAYGIIQDAAFTFTADNSVWVGTDGEIFDSIPATGVIIQKAGVASEDKKMLIDFGVQILKS